MQPTTADGARTVSTWKVGAHPIISIARAALRDRGQQTLVVAVDQDHTDKAHGFTAREILATQILFTTIPNTTSFV